MVNDLECKMNNLDKFKNQVAVITGAGSGIGKGLALHAASLGMKVVVAELSPERGEAVAQTIKDQGGEALFVQTDVTDYDSVKTLAKKAREAFGDICLLVNNAGISVMGKIWEVPMELWDRSIDVNFRGALHGIKAFLPEMLASGKPGFICNLGSLASFSTDSKMSPYFSTKHAILSLSECLSIEMKEEEAPIQISLAAPGLISTRIFEDTIGVEATGNNQKAAMKEALQHLGMPPEEAARIIFEGIAAGDFVVSTHPPFTEAMAAERGQYLCDIHNRQPQPSNPTFMDEEN
jgi:NAD(P)-dependent dehydrogenase (short-subunit alcohol dehydrogenase family)